VTLATYPSRNASALRNDLAYRLTEARDRTYQLLAPVSDQDLARQHSPIMSPLVWDLAHIGNFEELWLVQALGELPPFSADYDDMYDAFKHPRRERPGLSLLNRRESEAYLAQVRAKALEHLASADFSGRDALTRDGFVFEMIIQHEYQHNETMLATLQLMQGDGYRPSLPPTRPGIPPATPMVLVGAGPFVMGTNDRSTAYDNERIAHEVELPAYWIDTTP